MDACRLFLAAETAGCAVTPQRQGRKSGDLTATRRTLAGFRALVYFRGVRSLLHRFSLTAASSLRWGSLRGMATHLRLFMRLVRTARATLPGARSYGLRAKSAA